MARVFTTILAWMPVLAWSWWTYTLLCDPEPGAASGVLWSFYGNLGHVFLFGMMALFFLPGLVRVGVTGSMAFWTAFILSGGAALTGELLQVSIPTRSGSLLDLVSGLLGAAFSLCFLWGIVVRGRPGWLTLILLVSAISSALFETMVGSVLF